MTFLRRAVQVLFLFLFIYLIIATTEPLSSPIPSNIFFITNPLIALITIIASRIFVLTLAWAVVIILITLFLGRVYCGWVCPLGTTLDILGRSGLRQIKGLKISPGWRKVKYFILTVLIISAVFGVGMVGWVDPISITYKAYALVFYPAFSYIAKEVLHNLGFRQLVSDLIGSGIISYENISFQYSFLWLIIFAAILLLNLIQTRFWCRNLCPLGALLGLLSRWRLLRVLIGPGCQECARCIQVCKTGAIMDDLAVLDEECIHCFTCQQVCKFKAIAIRFRRRVPAEVRLSVLPSRRGFLIATVLGVVSAPLLRYNLGLKKPESLTCLRPPGAARDESVFLARCIRCGECLKVCPTNGLQPALFQTGLYGMWSPVLIPRIGECDYECNLCIKVCPTNALASLDLPEKKQWKIGLARIDYERCTNCLVCEEHCPVPGKAIKITVMDGLKYPLVSCGLCIGCGVCEKVCSESAIRVVPLTK